MPKCNKQKGGSSAFMNSFYSNTAVGGPAAISKATLAGINDAPMFNPLSHSATVPGNSTGIIPSGLYLAVSQTGGAVLDKMSTPELRSTCNKCGISCRGQKGGYKRRDTMIKQIAGACGCGL